MSEILTTKYTFYSEIAIPDHLLRMISEKETPLFAVKTVRDAALFTDKRILIADKQGITGRKVEYYTIPYKSVITYAIETAGTFDLDSEIKLWLSGGKSIELQFMKDKNMNELLFKVYHILSNYVL